MRYYGVLAPHAALRQAVIATAGPGEALAMQLREAAAAMVPEEEPAVVVTFPHHLSQLGS